MGKNKKSKIFEINVPQTKSIKLFNKNRKHIQIPIFLTLRIFSTMFYSNWTDQ